MTEKILALASVLLTAFAYLTGFAYLDGYYEYYDVSVRELEFGSPDILVHAAIPYRRLLGEILSGFSLLLVLVAAALALAAVAHNLSSLRTKTAHYTKIASSVAAIVLVALLTSAGLRAHEYGIENARSELNLLNRVAVIDPNGKLDLEELLERKSPRILLTHLTSTSDTFYVIARFEKGVRRWVLRIPRQDGIHLRVYQQDG